MKSHYVGGFSFNTVKAKLAKIAIFHFLTLLLLYTTTARGELPQILVQPTNQSTTIFGSAVFSVTVQSSLPVSYQWSFNGYPIANETNADLILGLLTCAQSGYYNCIVSNASGAISSSKAKLTVYQTVVGDWVFFQNFLLQFTNVMQVSGGSSYVFALLTDGTVAESSPFSSSHVPPGLSDVATISCNAVNLALESNGMVVAWGSGTPTVPTNLIDVLAITSGNEYSAAVQGNGVVVAWLDQYVTNSTAAYGVSNITAAISGSYNQFFLLKADGTVFNWDVGSPPQLVPGVSNIIAFSSTGFYAVPAGLAADGKLVGWDTYPTNPLPGLSNLVAFAAAASSIVALKSDGTVGTSNAGFPLVLSNVFSVNYDAAAVAVIGDGSPVFTVQPGNQTWTNTSTIYLHARAVGVQPMSYQWQFDGTNILGATNADLTITNAQEIDTGHYSATASNVMDMAMSRLASVAIVPAPPPPPPPNPYTLAQALTATNLPWTTFGNSNWFPEVTNIHNGIAAAQSGPISNNMVSTLETTVTGPGTLTFWWQVSSEEFFDFLSFYIDSGTNYAARISGEVGWEQEAFPIPSGTHSLSWVYAKDPDISVGEDAGWLSEVAFIPSAVQLGAPTFTQGGSLLFNAYGTNGNSLTLSGPLNLVFEVSSNLIDWTPLTNGVTLTNGSAELNDPDATNSTVRFYRLMKQ
jgi:hypothetical protein